MQKDIQIKLNVEGVRSFNDTAKYLSLEIFPDLLL